MRTGNPIKRRKQRDIAKDRVLYAFNYLFLLLIFIIVGYPLLIVVSNSLSSPEAVTGGKVWLLPVDFSLEGYQAVFQDTIHCQRIPQFLLYMIVGTAINIGGHNAVRVSAVHQNPAWPALVYVTLLVYHVLFGRHDPNISVDL
ncbi:MAG: hypothetical protein ACLR23_26735 [Clostridia bacterium]